MTVKIYNDTCGLCYLQGCEENMHLKYLDSEYNEIQEKIYKRLVTYENANKITIKLRPHENGYGIHDVGLYVYHNEWLSKKLKSDFGEKVHVEYVISQPDNEDNEYDFYIDQVLIDLCNFSKLGEPVVLNSLQNPVYLNGERIYGIFEIGEDKEGKIYIDIANIHVNISIHIYLNGKSNNI